MVTARSLDRALHSRPQSSGRSPSRKVETLDLIGWIGLNTLLYWPKVSTAPSLINTNMRKITLLQERQCHNTWLSVWTLLC